MNLCYVFLDVDGVLNSHEYWARRKEHDEGVKHELMGLWALDPLACQRLQRICAAFGASIVLTSTWRKYHTVAEIAAMFVERGLTAPVIGRTPDLSHHKSKYTVPWSRFGRGLEVQWWLQRYLPSNEAVCAAKFVCIDDDGDYGDLLGKLVQTRMATGLTDLEGDYIGKHLRESLMDSSAAGGKGRVLFQSDVTQLAPYWGRQNGPFGPG